MKKFHLKNRQKKIERQKKKSATKKRQTRVATSKGKDIVYQMGRTIQHFFPDLVERMKELDEPRSKEGLYSLAELIAACIAMFLFKQGSRKAMNDSRYEGNFAKNYFRLFRKLKLPHMDTVDRVIRLLKEEELEGLKTTLIKTLINRKIFNASRFLGKYFCVAIDGSGLFSFEKRHCEHCLTKTLEKDTYFLSKKAIKSLRNEGFAKWILQGLGQLTDRKFETISDFFRALEKELGFQMEAKDQELIKNHLSFKKEKVIYSHHILEAKLITANGFSISIASEWIENPEGDFKKQDCELKACKRLAQKLKTNFSRLFICLVVDGLYPSEPFFELCQEKEWEFMITFKDDTLNSVQEEVKGLKGLSEDQRRSWKYKQGQTTIESEYQWINAIEYRGFELNWIECVETELDSKGNSKTTRFVFLSSQPLTYHNCLEVLEVGRRRWKIENQGFNCQKNLGYELEHQYSRVSLLAAKNYYQCLQIAHMMNQLLELSQFTQKKLEHWKSSLQHLWKALFAFLFENEIDENDYAQFLDQKTQFRYS